MKFLKIFLVLSIYLVSSSFVYAQSLDTKLYTNSLDVSVGDEVRINLFLNPEIDKPVYTVSNTLKYDTETLEFDRTDFAQNWIILSAPEYFSTDTLNGVLLRTAGLPGGANSQTQYLTYIFKAKKEGVANLYITNGTAYDAEGKEINLANKQMSINISPEIISDINEGEKIPQIVSANLGFDVYIKPAIREGEDYNLVVPIDPSHSSNETGNVNVVVYNDLRNVVYTNRKSFGLNSGVVDFVVPWFTLKAGEYYVSIETTYDNSGKKYFAEKQLGVLESDRTWADEYKYQLFSIFFAVIILAFLHHIFVDQKRYDALLKKYRRKKK